jgi:glycyl-tRNA synthetase beta chain
MAERDLLVEIGCEEIPARFVEGALKQLDQKLTAWLKENRIDFAQSRTYATPRRLAVLVEAVGEKQPDVEEEVRGPAKRIAVDAEGNWTKAAEGFARKQGLSVDELVLEEHKGETYVFAKKHQEGRLTTDLLQEGLPELLNSLHFPKTMRWGSRRTRFIRPVRWMVCLFGEEMVPVEWAGVTAGNQTRGHRFLGEEAVVSSPGEYTDILRKQYVIADPSERRQMILDQLRQLEEKKGWKIPVDEGLLDEVTYLVEYPTALYGTFDEEFLTIPAPVLITTMREHQRYFPVEDSEGNLLAHFITVRNGDDQSLDQVAKGNEKVLSARLADARFFYEEDLKLPIETAVKRLDKVVYFDELGTVGDQVRRVRSMVLQLADRLGFSDTEVDKLRRAAEIAKFDLSTHMVDEFPELSGVMGKEYARKAGENEAVAEAILEHHYPRFAGDRLPASTLGALISVADKVDAVVSAFAIGIQPTGSQDPYGLRRRAAGVIQILIDQAWKSISLKELISIALDRLSVDGWLKRPADEVREELMQFFALRLKAVLQEEGIRYDIIDAVLAADITRPKLVLDKARVLAEQVEQEDFKNVVEAFSRAANLAEKAKEDVEVDRDYMSSKEEHALHGAYQEASLSFAEGMSKRDARKMYEALVNLAPVIHEFFEHVLVMAEDDQVRNNRLALLRQINQLVSQFAAFKHIVFAS